VAKKIICPNGKQIWIYNCVDKNFLNIFFFFKYQKIYNYKYNISCGFINYKKDIVESYIASNLITINYHSVFGNIL
jgi:hypothetical protein